MINEFRGKYYFLSNFSSSLISYNGLVYFNAEAAFQAAKCDNDLAKFAFTKLDPSSAKKRGRQVSLRSDWEEIKEQVMYDICYAKFTQNPSLGKKLIETGEEPLEEGNEWGDRIWGTVNGIGENKLGKILMRIREELINKELNRVIDALNEIY